MRNYALRLAYDGSRYRGWQRLPDTDNTVQGKLEAVLTRYAGQRVEVSGSGRTDAGVHAQGQVASFRLQTDTPCAELLQYLRQYLPEDIGALALRCVPPTFHARINAQAKTYRYRVWNSDEPCVFDRRWVYQYPQPLELERMRQAAQLLTGTRDFAAFCTGARKKSTVRTLERIEITRAGSEVILDFTADGFLYNMVRILTGTLLEVGDGRRTLQSVREIRMRADAGFTVPAKGLCLREVTYGNSDFWHDEVL